MDEKAGPLRGYAPPRVGDQLELGLAGPGRAWLEPWGGASPRVLTRTFKKFSLRAPPTGGLRDNDRVLHGYEEELPLQLELFPLEVGEI